MKSISNPFLRSLATAAAILAASHDASAAVYQWDGSDSSDWNTAANWVPSGSFNGQTITVGPAPAGVTAAHRLNVNNQADNALVYSAALGTTNYGSSTVRGLAIGSGALPQGGSGTMTITGGTFSTLNATGTQQDIIGNGDGNTGTLNITGGTFIGATAGTSMNLGGLNTSGRVSNLNISGTGTATLTSLVLNGTTININLDGGLLELNGFPTTAISLAAKIRLNGGTLKARQNNASFIPANALLETLVQSGGAVIDTNTFDITIAEPLLEDAGSTGGGITKNNTGLLTLTQPSTTTGPADVNAGGLAVRAGAASWIPSSFSHSGNLLNFDLGVFSLSNPTVINTGALTVDSAVTVNVTGSNFQVGQIPLINYASKSITGSLTLNPATLPPGVVATLVDNGTNQIYLDVTQAATIFTWSGATGTPGTGDWDTSSLNWNTFTTAYSTANSQLANFPDIALGGTVNITSAFSPLIATISNASGNPYTFSGAGKFTGATVVNKSNTGIATFASATNDYTGATTISGGALVKEAADSTSGNITVTGDNISFVLKGGVTDGSGQTLNIAGRGITSANYFFTGSAVQRGALQAQNGSNTWNGNVVLTSVSETRFGVQDGASLTIGGTITESVAGVSPTFRAGAANDNITLNGACSWTGNTFMFSTGGSIRLGGNDRLPTATTIKFTGSATVFDLNGYNQQVSGLTDFNPTVTNGGATPSVLTLSPLIATTNSFFGLIVDGTQSISVVHSGDGTTILGGANTYSGTTTVNSGTLLINGNQIGATGAVQVNGGTLGGTATIGGAVTVAAGGKIAPGSDGTIETLDVTANTAIAGIFACDVNAAATDRLVVTGDLTLTGSTLAINPISPGTPGSYVIASYTGDRTGTLGGTLPAGYSVTYDDTNKEVELVIAAAGYSQWAITNNVLLGENGDDDKDGVINLVEYALGLNPQVSSVPAGSFAGNLLTFTKGPEAKVALDVTYQIETSTTLDAGSWTPAAATETTDSISYLLPPNQPGGKLFARLKVTKP